MSLFRIVGVLFLVPILILWAMNPALDDGMKEVKKRIKEEQSSIRAGWNGVAKITGLDWLGKQASLGNFELCRKNLYVASLFVVRDVSGKDREDQLAVGLGLAGRIWGEKLMESGEISDKLLNGVARPLAASLNFSECAIFKKSGRLL